MIHNESGAVNIEALQNLQYLVADEFPAIVGRYLQDAERHIQAMEEAYLSLTLQRIIDSAHSLKGSSGTLAACHLHDLCFELEQAAALEGSNLARIATLLKRIREEYGRVRSVLNQCVQEETAARQPAEFT